MTEREKEGYYCSICGGIPPERVRTKKIVIEGKETGIENLETVFEKVKELGITEDGKLAVEILRLVKQFNYIPTKKEQTYLKALLEEYRRWEEEQEKKDMLPPGPR